MDHGEIHMTEYKISTKSIKFMDSPGMSGFLLSLNMLTIGAFITLFLPEIYSDIAHYSCSGGLGVLFIVGLLAGALK